MKPMKFNYETRQVSNMTKANLFKFLTMLHDELHNNDAHKMVSDETGMELDLLMEQSHRIKS